jgi:hypothetical protein
MKLSHIVWLTTLVAVSPPLVNAQPTNTHFDPDANISLTSKALRPVLFCDRKGDDWEILLQFRTVEPFERFTWLQTANPIGGQLQVCLTNGVLCQPKNPKVLEAFNLPFYTTVSNALRGVPWETRTSHWPRDRVGFQTAGFSLKSVYGMSFTNDVLLQMVPLMYKENTNTQTVWLVSFPPLRVKLKADGTIQKLASDGTVEKL